MAQTVLTIRNLKEVQRAFDASPGIFKDEAAALMARIMSEVRRVVMNDPWRIGMDGGGSPVKEGTMRDAHRTEFFDFKATYGPNLQVTPYAADVHKGRPWLRYAEEQVREPARKMAQEMLEKVAKRVADKV